MRRMDGEIVGVVRESPQLCCSIHDGSRKELVFFFFNFYKLFIYLFWLHWVFVAALGLSLVVAREVYSSLRCAGGFSCCGARALERRLSSCGTQA